MFQFILSLSTLVAFVTAYGSGGGGGGGYGHGSSSGYGHGGGGHSYGHSVKAAVISHHQVKHYDVPSSGHVSPTTIDVPANVLPLNFIFRSASSHINVDSKHQGAPGGYKTTHSQDEPHKLVHTVTKPIYQEVHEIITPYRKITQTVEPVHEEIKTIVARHGGHHGGGGGHYGGGHYGGGHGMSYGGSKGY